MAFFLMAPQCALDTSWMYGRTKTLMNQLRQFARANSKVLLTRLANESQNFLGELVRLFGAALVRHQPRQSILLEYQLRLVERGPGETEGGCSVTLASSACSFGFAPAISGE